ncbi:MAG: general secretion pathway protein E, partial [Candidatus Azotimanducaceae bacterium]
MDDNDLLGQRLLAREYIDENDVERACKMQDTAGGRFGSALIRLGALSEDHLLEVLSEQLGMQILEAEDLPESSKLYRYMSSLDESFEWFLSQELAIWEPENDLDGHAVDQTGNQAGNQTTTLKCVARDVLDPSISETLRQFHPGVSIQFYLLPSHLLDRLMTDLGREHSVDHLFQNSDDAKQLRELAEEAPVVEFVNNIMAQAVDVNASDIHIEPEEKEFKIRFRVDGVLQSKMSQPSERFPAVASRIKLVSGLDIAERRLPQDGRMTTRLGGVELDVRVSTVPCVHGESIVMRLLPKEREELSLDKLGMEADHLSMMRDWANSSGGIVLVTGPTGSGKSTMLHAALSDANDGVRKII